MYVVSKEDVICQLTRIDQDRSTTQQVPREQRPLHVQLIANSNDIVIHMPFPYHRQHSPDLLTVWLPGLWY